MRMTDDRLFKELLTTSYEERAMQKQALNIVQSLVERRFGPQKTAVQRRLTALTTAQLETLAVTLLDFQEASDLTVWLKENASVRKQRAA